MGYEVNLANIAANISGTNPINLAVPLSGASYSGTNGNFSGRVTTAGSTSTGLFMNEYELYSFYTTAPQGGPTEMFRVGSTNLCTNGIFSLSATRGSFVHGSMWSWSTSHNGTGQAVLTQLSSNNYTNITVYIDMSSGGSCIISADWGNTEGYQLTLQKFAGGQVDFSAAGTLWTSPNASYPTRYSRTTLSLGFKTQNGAFDGSLSKGSGSFNIPHPLPQLKDSHRLVHSFVEGPQADLIYRGQATLVNGATTINIDTHSGMTEGTFEALCRDVQCFTSNESGWTAVKGSVTGNILTISSQSTESTDTISWMVVGERKDPHMYETEWTDSEGRVIVEPLTNPGPPNISPEQDLTDNI